MTVTDRTDATPEEFAARIAPFDIFAEERVVEEVARAMFDATHDRGVWDNATAWGQQCRDNARRLASVAVGAYRATQDGGAEA